MKKNRFIAAILSTVLCLALFSVNVSAEGDATFAFDNDTGLSMWSAENEALIKAAGFKTAISTVRTLDGAGSLAVSENFTGVLDRDTLGNGTFSFAAESIGLKSFAGCIITADICPLKSAMLAGAEITFYTDGMLYLPTAKSDWTPDKWNTVSMAVPANCDNTRLGFFVPVFNTYSGVAFYVDNLTIIRPDGTVVGNIGDFELPSEEEGGGLNKVLSYILIGLLVLAGMAVIMFVIVFIIKHAKRFR
jgi:hypothetical protein